MRARSSLTALVLAGALAGTAPAVAGAPKGDTSHDPSASARHERGQGRLHPRHTSGNEPGPIAEPIPSYRRGTATRGALLRRPVAPGVTYTEWSQRDARGPIRAHLLSVDLSQPGVGLDYAAPGRVRDTARVSDILARDAAVAGVNGDFFDIGHTGAPLGLGVDRQQGLLHGRETGYNSAFYLDGSGAPQIGLLGLRAGVDGRPGLHVTNLNSPFVAPGGIGIYTPRWGRTAGYEVTDGQRRHVRLVTIVGGVVRASTTVLRADRPIRGTLLVGRGAGARALGRLRVGTSAAVHWSLPDPPQMAITGNRFLVRDGLINVSDDRQMHPRTAIGIDRDTGEVLVLVVDGRQSSSRGYTMVELADLMIDLGADSALNLDGGGSSTMVARTATGTTGVVNSPSDGRQRHVANALEITYAPPA